MYASTGLYVHDDAWIYSCCVVQVKNEPCFNSLKVNNMCEMYGFAEDRPGLKGDLESYLNCIFLADSMEGLLHFRHTVIATL